jgi:hypothetical protein
MFTDPQSITIDAVAVPLPRVSTGELKSKYQNSNGGYSLRIEHSLSNRERSLVRLDAVKVGADPLISGVQRNYTAGVYLVIDRPLNEQGWTDAELKKIIQGFLTYANVSATIDKVLGLES